MKDKKNRIKVSSNFDVCLDNHPDILSKLDEIRKQETADGISRASMVRIAILEAYDKRKNEK